ncbi:MAG: hypothetical protein ABEJ74_05520 [Haloferacaceae archaeon]
MNRRRFLATAGAAAASLSGCIGSGMPTDAVVRTVQESPPADVASVAYDELPPAEQEIARTAVEEAFYHACADLPPALRSFSERFDGPDDAYLEYQGTSYAVWIRIEDTIRAGTAPPPENEPSCGLL